MTTNASTVLNDATLDVRIAPPPAPAAAPIRAIAHLGEVTRRSLERVGDNVRFTATMLRSIRDVRTWGPNASLQMRRLGIDSMPIGIFIAVFTGIVLSLLASYSFTGAVPLYFVGTLVEKTITMELAPVLTGLALAGRVGANIAAELGTMRVTEQIDALETLAYDPHAYLVVPRVLAGTLMFPIVVAAAMLTGVLSGWVASIGLLDLSSADFVKGMRLFFSAFDVRYGIVKAASFGFVVTVIGCIRGLRTTGGAEGVGRAATGAVVYSAVMILVLDAFWAVVWLLGSER
jgi:phospholipid/cholesterol/gamma-HCH transport system permease protein